MPLRSFPFPINVGTDICSVQRIFRIIGGSSDAAYKYRNRLAERILTPKELESRWVSHIDTVREWNSLQKHRKALVRVIEENSRDGFARKIRHESRAMSSDDSFGYPSHGIFMPGDTTQYDDAANIGILDNLTRATTKAALDAESLGPAKPHAPASSTGTSEACASQENVEGKPAHSINEERASISRKITEDDDTGNGHANVASGCTADAESASSNMMESLEKSTRVEAIDAKLDKILPIVWNSAQFLAGRFAAKEAAIKAYQSRRLTYQDIEILAQPQEGGISQAPMAIVKPEDGNWDEAQIIPMSISHDGGFAIAICMAYEKA